MTFTAISYFKLGTIIIVYTESLAARNTFLADKMIEKEWDPKYTSNDEK